MNEQVQSAVGPIGLCLSGGGFRAVAFHLGTLSYLDHLGLRESIRQLSTVSGGTYIGAKYVVSLMEGVKFEDFFRDYYRYLETTNLMEMGLDALDDERPATPSGRHHLIACMARAHLETSMKDREGRPYLFGRVLDANLPIREIVFNATELHRGEVFRFQASADGRMSSGTEKIKISRADAAQIRMADIVAASSCFPGGFEPFAFPDDFVWPNREPPETLRKQFQRDGKPAPVLLVDGCVADNPGIQSIHITNREVIESAEKGLLIISDIDPHVPEMYSYQPPGKDSGPTLNEMVSYAKILLGLWLLIVVGLGGLVWAETEGVSLPVRALVSLVPMLLAGGIAGGLLWFARKFQSLMVDSLPEVGASVWHHLMRTRLHQFMDMMKLRTTLMLKVSNLVYPTRIRALLYDLLDTDPVYRDRYISNVLCELTTGYPWPDTLPSVVQRPTPALTRMVDTAEAVPITLWFESPEQLPCLVATGQADTCFNLMEWIARCHGADPSAYPAGIRALWDQLMADWKALNANPYALLQSRLPGQPLASPSAAHHKAA